MVNSHFASMCDNPPIPLAIVGMAFEFPQEATSVEGFWEMICRGRSASTEFPPDRMNIDAFYHPGEDRPSTLPVRGGHFLEEDLGCFDASFFTITPGEAACMDPQQRRMLEIAYHALEDAGIPISKCAGSDTSVYTGCFTNDYLSILQQDYEAEQRHAAMGVSPAMLANRLSWFFDFKGTSMNLDSACSSSLVALHLACQDLRAGNSSMALVGGANLVYHPNFMKIMSDFNFLSRDSRCWSFDQRANGYARGDGIAILVVKRLDDAIRNGDTIRAVIRNTGSNQDGRTPGITQPSQHAQIDLINKTYRQGHIDMSATRFFEAHATGTPVGDPVEGNAIGEAFRKYRSKDDPLYVGAVKANIGHLEGCSGLAGIIKTVLVLEKGLIPPIAGLGSLNSRIDAERLNLCFPTKPIQWPVTDVRRACVNSFGFGGTNSVAILDDTYNYLRLRGLRGYHRTVHVLSTNGLSSPLSNGCSDPQAPISTNKASISLDPSHFASPGTKCENIIEYSPGEKSNEYLQSMIGEGHDMEPTLKPSSKLLFADRDTFDQEEVNTPKLLVWSAPDQQGAQRLSTSYQHYISKLSSNMDDLVYSLVARKSHFPWKAFSVIDMENQASWTPKDVVTTEPAKAPANNPQLAFAFTGQGAQYIGMGRELISYPVFRGSLANCAEYLQELGCEWSPLEIIQTRQENLPINLAEFSQPLTTCLQIALVDLLQSWGLLPKIVLGHSSGEIAAAYSTGALSKPSAVKVAYYRGLLSSRLAAMTENTGMIAVGRSRQDVVVYLDRLIELDNSLNVTIGCVNSPKSVTLTGDIEGLGKIEEWLKADGVFSRRLHVPIAYHSGLMKVIANEYADSIRDLYAGQYETPVLMISSVSGDIMAPAGLISADYWVRNLTSTVEFESAYRKFQVLINRKSRSKLGRQVYSDFTDVTHVLEIGPHSALRGPIRESVQAFGGVKETTYVPSLVRITNAISALLTAIGILHCSGHVVDILSANNIEDSPRPLPRDLPLYPFNHSMRHWKESVISENFRFREAARHDLLGTRSLDWNPHMAQWRNVMRLAELPWLEDHKIGPNIVFPAAGMVSMVVEGLRQLAVDAVSFYGIHIRNISFSHAISFPQEIDNIETQLTLSRPSQGDLSMWSHFRLFVRENKSYIECCSGSIRAVLDAKDCDHVIEAGPWMDRGSIERWVGDIRQACQNPEINPYDMPAGVEIRYGPVFQNLEHLRLGGSGEAVAQVHTESWKLKTNTPPPLFIVHPATLDALAQPLLQALLSQRRGDLPTMVPVHVEDIWIDCMNPGLRQGNLQLAAKCKFSGYRGGRVDVLALGLDNSRPLICIKGLETAFISSGGEACQQRDRNSRYLCARLVWKPDIDVMTPEQILTHCTRDRPKQATDAVESYQSLVSAILCFIEEALSYVCESKTLAPEPHIESYISWMQYQQRRLHQGESLAKLASVEQLLNNPEDRERLNCQIEESGVEGFFFIQIGRQITRMLNGEVDPLDFMFRDKLADRYYEKMLGNDHHAYPASEYIDLLCFKNPSMNIFEVGAGTGGQTMRLLETLRSDGVNKWARYDYTDISPSFFSHAKEKFNLPNMNFQVCDISKDPATQNFQVGIYDLVVASHVLHATDRLEDSLRHIRRLLRPGGKLLLFETTRPSAIPVGFAFGLLKGWWSPLAHETRSPYSPCLTVSQWDVLLRKAGFTGIDIDIPSQEIPYCRDSSILISTAVSDGKGIGPSLKQHINIVRDGEVESQCLTANALEMRISAFSEFECEISTLIQHSQSDIHPSSTNIFLEEINATLLDGISEANYGHLQNALVRSKNTLWVTRAEQPGETNPSHHLVDGLGRTLASEDSEHKFMTLALNDPGRGVEETADLIWNVARKIVNLPVECLENNYVEARGILQIGRVSGDSVMNARVSKTILPSQIQQVQPTVDIPLELCFDSPGHLDSMEWKECSEIRNKVSQTLDSDEVIVEVRAVGLTFRDYLIAEGQYNEMDIGTECAGVIHEAGNKSGYHVGDRVCIVTSASAQSVIRVKASAIAAIPPRMTFAEAASIPSALWLSYHGLFNSAGLQKSDTVVVYQGASCVGQMAIQLALHQGARVITTTSSASAAKFIHDQFGIPEKYIICTKNGELLGRIRCCTDGQGVDVMIGAFSSSSDGNSPDFTGCLAPFGRLVDTSLLKAPGAPNKQLGNSSLTNMSSSFVNMVHLLKTRPQLVHQTFQRAMEIIIKGHIKPPQPLHKFSANNTSDAFRHFQHTDVWGKRVIEFDPITAVMANIKTRPRYSFNERASYVIGGGLGGLGRSIARWMVSRGARYLILLSRSGPKSNAAKTLVRELREQGAFVSTPLVDISSLSALKHMLNTVAVSMPPIRGCIQATVTLRDNLFPNMSYEDWTISVNSKATGSWNLHTALPSGLDFFVLLASLNGIIGGRAQANYAAGNTFKDALAHHRISLGEKAVAIDLGLMATEGIVAENADLLASMRRIGHLMDISQEELLALLDYYCDPTLSILPHDQAQVLVGLETPAAVKAKGIDLHHAIYRPLFRHMFPLDSEASLTAEKRAADDYAAGLKLASSDEEAGALVTGWFRAKIAQILGLEEEDVDAEKPIHTFGIDSLVAIDLKNWFSREIGAEVQVFLLLGNQNLGMVARGAATQSRFRNKS